MRKINIKALALLLCVCLVLPVQTVKAVDNDDTPDLYGAPVPMAYIEPYVPGTDPHGSGSYQLNETASDYRFYTEYFVKADTKKSTTTAGVERRTAIKVYAKKDEIILFGSSVSNSQIDEGNNYLGSVSGVDIVITTPNGTKISNDVIAPNEVDKDGQLRPNGLGYIKNHKQETNGPMLNDTEKGRPDDYYVPLQYQVTESGVYTFEFHSITGFNPNSASTGYHPTPKQAAQPWAQGNTAVAAWDVTVLSKKTETEWEVKNGRAWADYLALTTGGCESYTSDLDVHVLTHDGYQYNVNFKKAVPFGFIFFANNTGFMTVVTDEDSNTTSYRPIYHSFYDTSNDLDYMSNENIFLHKPNEVDTATEETYKIFFNAPNDDLNNVTYTRNGKTETIKTAPSEEVKIEDLKFSGGTDSHEYIARTGHGGYFTFTASDEAVVTIRLDLRKAIFESASTLQSPYKGSGIVELTAPVVEGDNRIYWDGNDTEGIVIPAGIYGDSNVVLATEVKRGELHFPVIDMEGLYGGLTVRRINGKDTGSADCYNLYYNNNPLVYGTIEGTGAKKKVDGLYYSLSDGTKSYKAFTDRSDTLSNYFTFGADTISTLKKDNKDYLSKKLFNKSYAEVSSNSAWKAIIDAEFDKELDTFHFEPVDSRTTSMQFKCAGFDGGGNQSGIDAWTYYTQGIDSQVISFAIMDTNERGLVKGQIFYDADISSDFDSTKGDYWLSDIKVRLVDSNGEPLVHKENLPCFDESGHFMYDENGKILHEKVDVNFETLTDSNGLYRFTGVPYSSTGDTTYYVQVLLTDVQTEAMRYTCTTSADVQSKLEKSNGNKFIPTTNVITSEYGADGNKFSETDDPTKIYKHKYDRISPSETVFDKGNAANIQSVTFTSSDSSESHLVVVKEFKKIGYGSTVPSENQKDYKITKHWGTDSEGNPTHQISDGLTVELWVWHDKALEEGQTVKLSRRTGTLLDTQVLNVDDDPLKSWTYTWKNLDDRLQYYILEYYTKKKPNGEIMYNDNGEPRMVLIGGTMPIFSTVPAEYSAGVYGFDVDLGEYPETIADPLGGSKPRIPIQKFDEAGGKTHTNSITDTEKLESIENNARQYDVTYTLSKQVIDGRNTNVIDLTNSQVFDDRTYYVWLDHKTELPDMIAQTYVDGGVKKSHAVTLTKDESLGDGKFRIKGLSVSSVDAAQSDNSEGNATDAFYITESGQKNAWFTATNHGNYVTGTGTRTYRVKYVVDATSKAPVSVATDDSGALVLADDHSKKVEELTSDYIVYSWYMTIHVYDVKPDGVIEYDPNGGDIVLQKALNANQKLEWELKHLGTHSISYTSNDNRESGILKNDIYRVPLYKDAVSPDMGSCADIVGIAYAGSEPVDDIDSLEFEDTFVSRYGVTDSGLTSDDNSDIIGEDGIAEAQGSRGVLTASLKTTRSTRIDRTQDHANYADVIFEPNPSNMAKALGSGEDVFYYKVVVFAEDNTYQYSKYEDIDASDGVMMYTYFTMKPKPVPPGEPVPPEDPTSPDDNDDPESTVIIGSKNPNTGDDNNLILWFGMFVFAFGMLAVGISKRKEI